MHTLHDKQSGRADEYLLNTKTLGNIFFFLNKKKIHCNPNPATNLIFYLNIVIITYLLFAL